MRLFPADDLLSLPPCFLHSPTTTSARFIHLRSPRLSASCSMHPASLPLAPSRPCRRVPSRKEGGSVLFCGSASENRSRSRVRGGQKDATFFYPFFFLPPLRLWRGVSSSDPDICIYLYIYMYVTRTHAGPITLSLSLCGLSLLVCICRLVSIRELTYGS